MTLTEPTNEKNKARRISVELPVQLINRFDDLKKQWGLRRRGAVLERLLEEVLLDEEDLFSNKGSSYLDTNDEKDYEQLENPSSSTEYIEDNSIVLIGKQPLDNIHNSNNPHDRNEKGKIKEELNTTNQSANAIDLPGFVQKRTRKLRVSLGSKPNNSTSNDFLIYNVKQEDIDNSLLEVFNHWKSLYGNSPNDNVLEASMIWLARDIWPHVDGTTNRAFTWNAAQKLTIGIYPKWRSSDPSFDRVIVLAGVIEDPFATPTLPTRIPTLIRRFVNSFKRRNNATSFQTLESTMTIHGALKLLDLPTKAGASLSLKMIREAYRTKAMSNHPDSGGTTDSMRRINEAYQSLKELYRKN